MHILLFIFYSLLCGYGILKIPFLRKTGIRPALLLGLFALHVLTGCLHNVIAWRYYPGHGDIWGSFYFSLLDRHLLTTQFHQLLLDNSTWSLFSHNGIRFVLVILNFFSFDNFYIDTLLFSFPVFLGNAALYRLFRRRFPADPLTAITVFILPSTLFWTSCIHREGMLYMLLGFLFYLLDRIFTSVALTPGRTVAGLQTRSTPLPVAPTPSRRPVTRRTCIYAFCCFLLIAYFRTIVAALLIPALLTWWFTLWPLPRRQAWLVAGICTGLLVIVLAIPSLSALPIHLLSHFQSEFRQLQGHSRLYLPAVDGSWSSVWRVLPAAILNGLFEPLPGSGGQRIYLVFSIELLLIWAVVLVALAFRLFASLLRLRNPPASHPLPGHTHNPAAPLLAFSRCCLVFSLLGLLLVGAIVPFAGAIVRYRSLYLPFLLAPFLHTLAQWRPLRRLNQQLATWLPDPDRGSIS